MSQGAAQENQKKHAGVRLPPAQKAALVEIAARLSPDSLGRTVTLSDVVRAVLTQWLARGMDACLRDLRAGATSAPTGSQESAVRSEMAEQARLRLAEKTKKRGRKPA